MEGNVSFIGIGRMGFHMALNIRCKLPQSSILYIYDVFPDACSRFVSEAASLGPVEVVSSAKEAAEKADIVISMVPGPEDVKKVYLDEQNGVVASDKKQGRLCLECSTIDSVSTAEVGARVMERIGGTYVDAPVSGGVKGAREGVLSFMIGYQGSGAEAARIRSIVEMMGSKEKIFFCGKLGTGVAAKISNNYLSGTTLVAICEAMAIGVRSGVDPKVLHDVIHHSSGQSWMGDWRQPVPGVVEMAMSSHGYEPSFRHELMVKDLSLGIDAGQKTGIQTSMANTAVEAYRAAAADPKTKASDPSLVENHVALTAAGQRHIVGVLAHHRDIARPSSRKVKEAGRCKGAEPCRHARLCDPYGKSFVGLRKDLSEELRNRITFVPN